MSKGTRFHPTQPNALVPSGFFDRTNGFVRAPHPLIQLV